MNKGFYNTLDNFQINFKNYKYAIESIYKTALNFKL